MIHVRRILPCLCLLVGACSGAQIGTDPVGTPDTGRDNTFGTGGTPASGGAGDAEGAGGAGGGGMEATGGMIVAPADGSIEQGDAVPDPVDGVAPPIDYSIWQLQLPSGNGSPMTVGPKELPAFSNAYFYKAEDGGQIFMDPVTGVTTPNSLHPRTELRELSATGDGAAWSAAGTNTMTVTGKVLKGSGVAIAQVFNGGDGITLAELQYSSGGFTLFYEEARGAGSSTGLGTKVALDTRYTFTMALTKGVLTVTINDKQVYSHTPGGAVSGSRFYFKVGNYDQGSTRGPVSTTARSIVEVYSAVVVHQ
jgi:hypothetical protein